MTITFNGKPAKIEEGQTVSDFLKSMNYITNRVSVWLDEKQLLMAQYDTKLVDGCTIKVLRILGGG